MAKNGTEKKNQKKPKKVFSFFVDIKKKTTFVPLKQANCSMV